MAPQRTRPTRGLGRGSGAEKDGEQREAEKVRVRELGSWGRSREGERPGDAPPRAPGRSRDREATAPRPVPTCGWVGVSSRRIGGVAGPGEPLGLWGPLQPASAHQTSTSTSYPSPTRRGYHGDDPSFPQALSRPCGFLQSLFHFLLLLFPLLSYSHILKLPLPFSCTDHR